MKKLQVFQSEANVWVVPCSLEIIHSRICVILKCSIVKSKEPAAELRSKLLCCTWVLQKERDCWDLPLRECKNSVFIDLATVVEKSGREITTVGILNVLNLFVNIEIFTFLNAWEGVYRHDTLCCLWIVCSVTLHIVEIQADGMW